MNLHNIKDRMKPRKKIPTFKDEDAEREFWAQHDSPSSSTGARQASDSAEAETVVANDFAEAAKADA